MKTSDLHTMVAGFDHEAYGSQAVFRTALNALSHPGRPLEMPMHTALPRQGHAAAAALLLGLVDSDTGLWLSPLLAGSEAAAWLRFHTGCAWVADPADAQFLWVAQGDALPDLHRLKQGTEAYPDQSATCVIEVHSLYGQKGDEKEGDEKDAWSWTLQGPGIWGGRQLQVQGLPADFQSQWTRNHASFPCGVDVFLATPSHIVGLPRTTRILNTQKA
jgi:alpha-D-ribose 1-methylphosphonate 5-triphosphate synthase subunit PhnH